MPLALFGGLFVVMANPASASPIAIAHANFPASVTVGQMGVPANVTVGNFSDGSNASDSLSLTSLTMVSSCGSAIPNGNCPMASRDPGVFTFSQTGVGAAGSACAGITYAITLTDSTQDLYTFQSLADATIAPGATCTINFTLNVVKLPNIDSDSAAGLQTGQLMTPHFTDTSTHTTGYSFFGHSTTVVPVTGPYSPLSPVRICDSRESNPSSLMGTPARQCNGPLDIGSPIVAGGTKDVNVAPNFGVPANATAVVLNVTVVNPAAGGYLTVFPTGAAQPFTSNLNYSAGEAVPNLVEVGLGSGGDVSIYSQAHTDVVVDLEGYVDSTAIGGSGAGLYNPLTVSARLCDTRAGNVSNLTSGDAQCNGFNNLGSRLGANGTIAVQVTGNNEIPAGATAAVLNVTEVNPGAAGFLTVYPRGLAVPVAANVNFGAGQTTGNRVIVPLSNGTIKGQLSIFSSAATDVVVDVSGYYSAAGGAGAQFSAVAAPVRICDTRPNSPSGLTGGVAQCNGLTIPSGSSRTINVTGLASNPIGARAVVLNLTAIAPTQGTYLTVYPQTQPVVSDLNPAAGEVKGNLVVATISALNTITIYNHSGNTNVTVDVLGWYS
jgi:hypothetical protein